MIGTQGTPGNDCTEDRRSQRRRSRLEQILAAAWALAEQDGLAAVSLHGIARSVGLRQPSLYVYVDSKAGLFDAMYAQSFERLLLHMAEVPHDVGSPEDRLRAWTRWFLVFAVAELPRAQLMFQRTLPGFEPSEAAYTPSLTFSSLTAERLSAVGATGPDDADLYSAMVGGLAAQQIANDPGGDRWVRRSDEVVNLFLSSVRRST